MFIHTIKDKFLSEKDLLFVLKLKNLSVVIVLYHNFVSNYFHCILKTNFENNNSMTLYK